MELLKLTLDDLRSKLFSWYRTTDDDIYEIQAFRKPAQYVLSKDLEKLDYRLPKAIDHIIDTTDQSQLLAGRVQATVEFWKKDEPRMLTGGPSANTYLLSAKSIQHSVEASDITINVVVVSIENVNGVDVAMAPSTRLVLARDLSWLEQNFPMSRSRLEAGLALNMDPAELAKYVLEFEEPPHIFVDMPPGLI